MSSYSVRAAEALELMAAHIRSENVGPGSTIVKALQLGDGDVIVTVKTDYIRHQRPHHDAKGIPLKVIHQGRQ